MLNIYESGTFDSMGDMIHLISATVLKLFTVKPHEHFCAKGRVAANLVLVSYDRGINRSHYIEAAR